MERRFSAAARGIAAALVVVALPLLEGTAMPSASGAVPRCTIVGTSGADRIVGTSRRDVICAGGGNDVIIGGRGDDIIFGGSGRDRIAGSDGNDRIEGGISDDVIDGGAGTDTMLGGTGNDDLIGGSGADRINGETGTNWCKLDAVDVASRCVYDKAAAKVDQVRLSAPSVDVSSGARTMTIRVHVTDDTGAEYVGIGPSDDTPWFPSASAVLTSGDVRNGWWTATLTVGRWTRPGTYVPQVGVSDRIKRSSLTAFETAAFEVRNAAPDLEQPEVTLLSPDNAAGYDVTAAGASVKIQARIVDPLSGVDEETVLFSLWAPRLGGTLTHGRGAGARLTSGTIKDGIWTASVYIPRNEVSGNWSVEIAVRDRAHLGTSEWLSYFGPTEHRFQAGRGEEIRPFPYDMGSFPVVGRVRTDAEPPIVSGATLSPATVDTLPGPATVDVSIDAADIGSGVDGMQAVLVPASDDNPPDIAINPRLTSGTRANGTWTGTFTLPQGLPPGTYHLKVYVWDREALDTMYISSSHPDAHRWPNQIVSGPMVTVLDTSP